jgi:hypothetical protein
MLQMKALLDYCYPLMLYGLEKIPDFQQHFFVPVTVMTVKPKRERSTLQIPDVTCKLLSFDHNVRT